LTIAILLTVRLFSDDICGLYSLRIKAVLIDIHVSD
jgi:hypothetical protein